MTWRLTTVTLPVLLLVAAASVAQDGSRSDGVTEEDKPFLLYYPNLDDPDGRVVLSNEHVVLQRLVVPAGEWEGIHSHPGNQLYVHIKGGEWSGRLGGEVEYWGIPDEDGAVGWMDAIPISAGHNSGNTGDTDIDLIYVTLKKDAPTAPDTEHPPQAYPNLVPEQLFENHRLIAQRWQLEPGQWTGVHGRPGNQVYILIKGGTWTERRNGVVVEPPLELETGSVGWLDAVSADEAYEVGNTGDTTIDLVLVTIK